MINDEGQRNDKDADDEGRDTVAPNVDAFVVEHEKTFDNFFGSVEVDSVAMRNMLIILHVLRSSVIISDRGLRRGLHICWSVRSFFKRFVLVIRFFSGHFSKNVIFKC
jgi:hypothetical protein